MKLFQVSRPPVAATVEVASTSEENQDQGELDEVSGGGNGVLLTGGEGAAAAAAAAAAVSVVLDVDDLNNRLGQLDIKEHLTIEAPEAGGYCDCVGEAGVLVISCPASKSLRIYDAATGLLTKNQNFADVR